MVRRRPLRRGDAGAGRTEQIEGPHRPDGGGELFSDGIQYDKETADYLSCLARLNRAAAEMADRVYEVVCGIPVRWKGEGE